MRPGSGHDFDSFDNMSGGSMVEDLDTRLVTNSSSSQSVVVADH